jgi:polysaccharide export outer membrane protein
MGALSRQTGRLACLLLLLLAAGCETTSQQAETPAVGTLVSAPAEPAFTGSLGDAPADYRIGGLDVLEVTVFGVPELTKMVQVSSSGWISLPLIGPVTASGKSVAELEAEIADRLGATYLQSPQVGIFVKEATSQRVTVGGAVRQPGIFPIAGRMTLLQMIALAQGLDPIADPRTIIVFRNVGGQRMAARFDLSAISTGKADDPVIRAGDIVMVDQSGAKAALRSIAQALPVISIFTPLL